MTEATKTLHTPPDFPLPGVPRCLGLINLVHATVLGAGSLALIWRWLMVALAGFPDNPLPGPAPISILFSLVSEPILIQFGLACLILGLPFYAVEFIDGIGLFHLKKTAILRWRRVCHVMILWQILVWGIFILVVGPRLASGLTYDFVARSRLQGETFIPAASLNVYRGFWIGVFVVLGLTMMLLGAIFPAVSSWLLRGDRGGTTTQVFGSLAITNLELEAEPSPT